MPLQAVEPKRLYRQIAEQLAQLIASGEFAPGARLPAERELAVTLGVSRTSVREAIISLEMSGLVEVRVGTGIFVAARRDAAARAGEDAGPGPFELLDARKLVEGEVAALAARNAGADDISALQESVARMAASMNDFSRREAEDEAFHRLLARATGNGSLELVVENLWGQRAGLWGRLQSHFHTDDLTGQTVRDHRSIVAAVAARDPERARNALHRHLARVAHEFQRGVDGRTAGAPADTRAAGARGTGARAAGTAAGARKAGNPRSADARVAARNTEARALGAGTGRSVNPRRSR